MAIIRLFCPYLLQFQNNILFFARSPSISPSFGLAMANAAAATAANTSNGGGGGVGNDPTKIGLQIVSEFRSESMNSNSSSETSPLPDYIFHQVTPAATTQQSHLQVSHTSLKGLSCA